jgi:hypothetical protein
MSIELLSPEVGLELQRELGMMFRYGTRNGISTLL